MFFKSKKDKGIGIGHHHHDDHHLSTRRNFLKQLGLISAGSFLFPQATIQALGSTSLTNALLQHPSDRILVLIRLKGGNDGLNTIIPLYDYSAYRNARPTLAYKNNEFDKLSDEFAVAKDFEGALSLWNEGKMKIVQSVGYEDASLSHFRGFDIWSSASDVDEIDKSGVFGRYFNEQYPEFLANPPETPPAIQIGGAGSILFNNDENVSLSVTVNDSEELINLGTTGKLYDTVNLPDCYYGQQLGFLRGVENGTFKFGKTISSAYQKGKNQVSYPKNDLADQLAVVARLISGGLGTNVYMVTLGGFDTHADARKLHGTQLQRLGSSIKAFYDDLKKAGNDNRVLASTISEFGRRVDQNSSGGLDHGTAAPQLIFGPSLNGNGSIGTAASLTDLDANSNLKFHTDFRSVYATLLQDWLCFPSDTVDRVLGNSYARLNLGFACNTVSTSELSNQVDKKLVSLAVTTFGQAALINYGYEGAVKLQLFDVNGRVVQENSINLKRSDTYQSVDVPVSVSFYKLTLQNGKNYSGTLLIR